MDNTLSSVRSSILITDPILDVKSAFAILSRDESHRKSNVHSSKSSSTVFVWQTIERFLELIGYPLGLKKNPKGNVSKVTVNSVSANSFGTTSGLNSKVPGEDWSPYELIYKSEPNLSYLISFGCLCFAYMLNNSNKFSARDAKFYKTIYPFKNQSSTKDFVLEINDANSFFFDNPRSNEPYNEEKDNNSKGEGTKTSSKVNAESKSCPAYVEDSTDLTASTSEKNVQNTLLSDNDNIQPLGSIIAKGQLEDVDATSDDDKYNSEGEDFIEFGQMFGSDDLSPDRIVNEETVRRSSRRSKFPNMLEYFELDGKVKYGLNRYVNYDNLSEAYCFMTNLNKTIKPKSYREA
nr:hypothetical protein [Tanacetum cinerariifolium]